MIIATNAGGSPRELVPAGSHIARCYQMIHIGTIQANIMGEAKILNKVRLTWEIPGEMRVFNEEKGEQPMVIDKEYTLSLNEKANLRKDIDSWRGKSLTDEQAESFDLTVLLGVECMLSIIHKTSAKGNEYAFVASVSRIPKGIEAVKQINPNFEFNYENHFDLDGLEKMPDFIKDMIKSSKEYVERIDQLEGAQLDEQLGTAEDLDNDLPFL